MAKLSDHQSSVTTKMLLIGDSGAGKTGALASLAGAGYNLRIIDTDNGLDILKNLLCDPNSPYGKAAADRVDSESITDKMKPSGTGQLIPAKATVWQRTVGLLNDWKPTTENPRISNFGPVSTWTSNEVLVIDSLTTLANAAMNFVLSMNARLGQRPQQSDWYVGQQLLESLLQMLYDENVKCNVIINCHIAYIGEENGPAKGYPNSLGKALSPKMGRYFNSILMAQTIGQGKSAKHRILTKSVGVVELKNVAPNKVPADYPLETGLADYFRDIRAPVISAAPPAGISAPLNQSPPATA